MPTYSIDMIFWNLKFDPIKPYYTFFLAQLPNSGKYVITKVYLFRRIRNMSKRNENANGPYITLGLWIF